MLAGPVVHGDVTWPEDVADGCLHDVQMPADVDTADSCRRQPARYIYIHPDHVLQCFCLPFFYLSLLFLPFLLFHLFPSIPSIFLARRSLTIEREHKRSWYTVVACPIVGLSAGFVTSYRSWEKS